MAVDEAGRRPRVAFFTPLPPIQSGISQYSAELLPLLARVWAIDVVIDRGYRPSVELGAGIRIIPVGRFLAEQRARPYAALIYQMGNSPAHAYQWGLVHRYPGLLVLHDYLLHHLRVWLAVHRRGARAYLAEMQERYGVEGAAVAQRTLRGQMPSSVFDYPLCESLVEASPVVAVHSRYAAGLVGERCGRQDIEQLPMGVPLYEMPTAEAARQRLGLPLDQPVIASLSHLSPHKRLDVALRAFRRLRERYPGAIYVIAGAESPGLNLERMVGMLGLSGSVRRLGYIDEMSVPDLLAAADLVVNLRYPTAGETSASLLRILAAGKAVIVSRAGAMAELPASVVAQVAPDAIEEDLLAELLLRLVADPILRQQLEGEARAFIEREHSLPRAAAAYVELGRARLGLTVPTPDWSPVIVDARRGGPTLAAQKEDVSGGHPPVRPGPDRSTRLPAAAVVSEELLDEVAAALVALKLTGHPPLSEAVATALVSLGLAGTAPRV